MFFVAPIKFMTLVKTGTDTVKDLGVQLNSTLYFCTYLDYTFPNT
jgi:hypothetical protein